MKRAIAFLILLLILPVSSFGTPQSFDTLIYNGKVHHVHYFKISPEMRSRLLNFLSHNNNENIAISSNHDNFFANLEIRSGALLIKKIDTNYSRHNGTVLSQDKIQQIFGVDFPWDGLHATWFTGELKEFFGKPFLAHTMSKVRVFYFKNGMLKNVAEKDYKPYQDYIKKHGEYANSQ